MSNSIIFIFLLSSYIGASDLKTPQGCIIPGNGPQRGVLPEECSPDIKTELDFLKQSQVRCKVLDVKCDPKSPGKYVAVAQVKQWLLGSGPQKISFKFSKKKTDTKSQAKILQPGRGLCADFTLERKNLDWILTKIENPTSLSDLLPVCP